MTTITYHTWKKRQLFARLVLLTAVALAILPTLTFRGSEQPGAQPYPLSAKSFPLLVAPPARQLSHVQAVKLISSAAEPVAYTPPPTPSPSIKQ